MSLISSFGISPNGLTKSSLNTATLLLPSMELTEEEEKALDIFVEKLIKAYGETFKRLAEE